jgi:hypothetical protein
MMQYTNGTQIYTEHLNNKLQYEKNNFRYN